MFRIPWEMLVICERIKSDDTGKERVRIREVRVFTGKQPGHIHGKITIQMRNRFPGMQPVQNITVFWIRLQHTGECAKKAHTSHHWSGCAQ